LSRMPGGDFLSNDPVDESRMSFPMQQLEGDSSLKLCPVRHIPQTESLTQFLRKWQNSDQHIQDIKKKLNQSPSAEYHLSGIGL
jgi:hypothetical protein